MIMTVREVLQHRPSIEIYFIIHQPTEQDQRNTATCNCKYLKELLRCTLFWFI